MAFSYMKLWSIAAALGARDRGKVVMVEPPCKPAFPLSTAHRKADLVATRGPWGHGQHLGPHSDRGWPGICWMSWVSYYVLHSRL